MSFEIHAHAQHGHFSSLTTVILVLLAFVYSRGWFRLRRASPISFPPWRATALVAGLFSVWIALCSPLAHLFLPFPPPHTSTLLLFIPIAPPFILPCSPH